MAQKSLESAFAEVMKDCQFIATEALRFAAIHAQADIELEADRYLTKYYTQYKPKRYKRTRQLEKAITTIFEDKLNKMKGGSIRIGVKYDPSPLIGLYRSNSWYRQSGDHWIARSSGDFDFDSQNNGVPDASWIVDNFVEGIHPRTRPNSRGGYDYIPKVYRKENTDTLMTQFFEKQLPNRIEQYFADELIEAIMNNL